MRHDALIGLPALARDEVEKRIRPVPATEEQVEKLVDKRIVRRERIAFEHPSGDALEQTALETCARALDNQSIEPVGKAGGKLQGNDATERNAANYRALQAAPMQKLVQIGNEILQFEAATQRKAVVLAAELIANDPVVLRQNARHWTKQLKTARQAGNQHEGRTVTPSSRG